MSCWEEKRRSSGHPNHKAGILVPRLAFCSAWQTRVDYKKQDPDQFVREWLCAVCDSPLRSNDPHCISRGTFVLEALGGAATVAIGADREIIE
jgi:hypothetical protein